MGDAERARGRLTRNNGRPARDASGHRPRKWGVGSPLSRRQPHCKTCRRGTDPMNVRSRFPARRRTRPSNPPRKAARRGPGSGAASTAAARRRPQRVLTTGIDIRPQGAVRAACPAERPYGPRCPGRRLRWTGTEPAAGPAACGKKPAGPKTASQRPKTQHPLSQGCRSPVRCEALHSIGDSARNSAPRDPQRAVRQTGCSPAASPGATGGTAERPASAICRWVDAMSARPVSQSAVAARPQGSSPLETECGPGVPRRASYDWCERPDQSRRIGTTGGKPAVCPSRTDRVEPDCGDRFVAGDDDDQDLSGVAEFPQKTGGVRSVGAALEADFVAAQRSWPGRPRAGYEKMHAAQHA